MIRSVRFKPEGRETRVRGRLTNSVIKERFRSRKPKVDVNIRASGFSTDLELDVRNRNASILLGWDDVPLIEVITDTESIDRQVLARIEALRMEAGRVNEDDAVRAAKITLMKESLGIAQNKRGSWEKGPTSLTHIVKIPSPSITTEHAILTLGLADGLTITPLTNQKGWISEMFAPKVYTFTINIKPGESAEIRFGFKW